MPMHKSHKMKGGKMMKGPMMRGPMAAMMAKGPKTPAKPAGKPKGGKKYK